MRRKRRRRRIKEFCYCLYLFLLVDVFICLEVNCGHFLVATVVFSIFPTIFVLKEALPNPYNLQQHITNRETRREEQFTLLTLLTSLPFSFGSVEGRWRSWHRSHTPPSACTHPPPLQQRRSSPSASPVGPRSRPRSLGRKRITGMLRGTVTEEEEEEKSVWVLVRLERNGVKVVGYV